jgi:outer membrane receptor protein involved in Fe transport
MTTARADITRRFEIDGMTSSEGGTNRQVAGSGPRCGAEADRDAFVRACFSVLLMAVGVVGAPASVRGESVDPLLDLPFDDLLQVEIRSAGKREQEIRDIPASVTIIGRDEIERYGWQTLDELLRNVPGFFLLDNTEDRFIGTRGAVGGGVQFLVNGIAQHPSLQKTLTVPEIARLDVPVESIDRIEIIRGPMSVIYGNNAFLGVVNIVSNDIRANGSRVSASAGTRGTGALFARLGQANSDGFFVLNASARRDDGLAGVYKDMMSPARLAGLHPAMHADMDGDMDQDVFSVDFSAALGDFSTDLRWNRRDYGIYAFTPAFDDGTHIRIDTLHASLGWSHRFGDSLGLQVLGTHSRERYEILRADFLFDELDGEQNQESRRWELELDLHWRPHRRLDTLFGYRLLHIDGVRNKVSFKPLVEGDDRLGAYTTHDLFAETSLRVREGLRMVIGARLTLLPSAYDVEVVRLLIGEVRRASLRPDHRAQLNGRAALLWTPRADQVVKLIWGSASQDSADASFGELEQIQTIELNTTLTREHWTLSASLFRNRIDNIARNIQLLDPETGDYRSVDDNSGSWRTHGVELIVDGRPLPDLTLSASLTWQQTDDRLSAIEPGYSPELLAKLRAAWQRGPLTYAGYAHYVDGMEPDWNFVTGPREGVVERIGERVPGYWNIGLNLRWEGGAGSGAGGPYAGLHVANLLDTDNRYPANLLTDFERGLIGPGRTVTATVGYAF